MSSSVHAPGVVSGAVGTMKWPGLTARAANVTGFAPPRGAATGFPARLCFSAGARRLAAKPAAGAKGVGVGVVAPRGRGRDCDVEVVRAAARLALDRPYR